MKKILGVSILVISAGVLFFNSKVIASTDTNSSDLFTLNTANAECPPYHIINGKCLQGSGVCVFGITETDCTP